MFYLCNCCCYKIHKWVLYIFTALFGLFGLAFLCYTIWLNDRFKLVIPPNILEFCFATTSFLMVTGAIGFKGTRNADDTHERRGRNYLLAIYFVCVTVGAVVISVQVDIAQQSLVTVDGCNKVGAVEGRDCPLQITDWVNANPSYWRQLQDRWDCCGMDTGDWISQNTALNSTCPPESEHPPGCRSDFMAMVFLACVAIIALSSVMLFAQGVSAFSACCLMSCKFPDRTVEGWSIDGHAFQILGQSTPNANAMHRRNQANERNGLVSPVNAHD